VFVARDDAARFQYNKTKTCFLFSAIFLNQLKERSLRAGTVMLKVNDMNLVTSTKKKMKKASFCGFFLPVTSLVTKV